MSFWIASAVRIRPRRRVCSWVSSPDGTSVGGRRRWVCISSVYCTSEQIPFSAADCSPLLLSSVFSFTLSFHCNLYLRTQFIKLVVSAGLFLLWVGLFGGTNRKEKWTYITVISLSFSLPVRSCLLTWHLVVFTFLGSKRLSTIDSFVSTRRWPCCGTSQLFLSGSLFSSSSILWGPDVNSTAEIHMFTARCCTVIKVHCSPHWQTEKVNYSWCDRDKVIFLSLPYVLTEKGNNRSTDGTAPSSQKELCSY